MTSESTSSYEIYRATIWFLEEENLIELVRVGESNNCYNYYYCIKGEDEQCFHFLDWVALHFFFFF